MCPRNIFLKVVGYVRPPRHNTIFIFNAHETVNHSYGRCFGTVGTRHSDVQCVLKRRFEHVDTIGAQVANHGEQCGDLTMVVVARDSITPKLDGQGCMDKPAWFLDVFEASHALVLKYAGAPAVQVLCVGARVDNVAHLSAQYARSGPVVQCAQIVEKQ